MIGIAGHNGEIELEEYWPVEMNDFDTFDAEIEKCYLDRAYANTCPSRKTFPAVGLVRPLRSCIIVDLPDPV